eukprot:bmy_15062T0
MQRHQVQSLWRCADVEGPFAQALGQEGKNAETAQAEGIHPKPTLILAVGVQKVHDPKVHANAPLPSTCAVLHFILCPRKKLSPVQLSPNLLM